MRSRQPLRALLAQKYRYRLVLQAIVIGAVGACVRSLPLCVILRNRSAGFFFGWAQSPGASFCCLPVFCASALLSAAWRKRTHDQGQRHPTGRGPAVGGILISAGEGACAKKNSSGAVYPSWAACPWGAKALYPPGACCGKGAAQLQGRNRTEEKYLITCGACAGLARRFQRAAGRRIVCLGGGAPQL